MISYIKEVYMMNVTSTKGIETELSCYDEFWLSKDMENMGYIFEYCEDYCKEAYDKEFRLDKIKFLTDFMKSDIRKLMDIGYPNIISQSAYDSVRKFIEIDNEGNIEEYHLPSNKRKPQYKHFQLYWVGWMYAYIHFSSKHLSKDIIEIHTLEDMLSDYRCGHELSKESYYKRIKWRFPNEYKVKNLDLQTEVVIRQLMGADGLSKEKAISIWMKSKTKAEIEKRNLYFTSGMRCYWELKLEIANDRRWMRDEFV